MSFPSSVCKSSDPSSVSKSSEPSSISRSSDPSSVSKSSESSSNGKSKTSGTCAKSGTDWKYKINFDPEADKPGGLGYDIKDDELLKKMSRLIHFGEKILWVYMNKTPIFWIQFTKSTVFHAFVVLATTDDYFWSIEKHSDGITIQRSRNKYDVESKYRQTTRMTGLSGMSRMKCSRGRKNIEDLMEWLHRTKELNKPYHFLNSNCQEFANSVYDFVTRQR